jgi:hypothetical protein
MAPAVGLDQTRDSQAYYGSISLPSAPLNVVDEGQLDSTSSPGSLAEWADSDPDCPIPNLSTVRCASSPPVICTMDDGSICPYEVACYASVAGFDISTQCVEDIAIAAESSSNNTKLQDDSASTCIVPDMSFVRCAYSEPVSCTGLDGIVCTYDLECAATAAGYDVSAQCIAMTLP